MANCNYCTENERCPGLNYCVHTPSQKYAINKKEQAGEPEVVTRIARNDAGQICMVGPDDYAFDVSLHVGAQFITLQSHRESMAKAAAKYKATFDHLLDVYAEFGAKWGDNIFLSIKNHTDKKDAALQACVEAMKKSQWCVHELQHDEGICEYDAAITQALEALK